jgi:hypothetical protein
MTAEIADYEVVVVHKIEKLILPDEAEPEYKYGCFQKERQRNNAKQKQMLWAYVRYHDKVGYTHYQDSA